MRKVLISTAFILSMMLEAQAQQFALHLSSPLGLINKFGCKVEYRWGNMGVLAGATVYAQYGIPLTPGAMGTIECRRYGKKRESGRGENFFYIKGLAGHQQYNPGHGDGFLSAAEVPAATYYGLGAGVGRHINFNWFFIELSTGAKYVYSDVPQPDFFYITGPGAIFDLHFNFGFQTKRKR
jgi:hypothetical protein